MRRVVVTGMGAITPLGLNVDEFWNGIKEGKHGFGEITKFDASEYKAHLAGEVKGFVGKEYMDVKAQNVWNCSASTQWQRQKKLLNSQDTLWRRRTHTEWDAPLALVSEVCRPSRESIKNCWKRDRTV